MREPINNQKAHYQYERNFLKFGNLIAELNGLMIEIPHFFYTNKANKNKLPGNVLRIKSIFQELELAEKNTDDHIRTLADVKAKHQDLLSHYPEYKSLYLGELIAELTRLMDEIPHFFDTNKANKNKLHEMVLRIKSIFQELELAKKNTDDHIRTLADVKAMHQNLLSHYPEYKSLYEDNTQNH